MTDFATFGGTFEATPFWSRDFEGVSESGISLSTVQFDFEISDPVPNPAAPTPTIVQQPVEPLLFKPFLGQLGRSANRLACYPPILRPKPKSTAAPTSPLDIWQPFQAFNGGIYFYNGETNDGGQDNIEHMGATLGYRTKGIFVSRCLPWSVEADVDFNSSVFDSDFLRFEYLHYLNQIGYVPGMAAHVKSTLGPTSLVVEWNGAVTDATFTDDLGRPVAIAPSAWQVSLGYQFGWNPTIQVIGEQGTFMAIGYSESRDLAGVTRLAGGEEKRIGFLPEKRFLVSIGEWIWEGVRVEFEYSRIWDYSVAEGGTGRGANGYFGQISYVW